LAVVKKLSAEFIGTLWPSGVGGQKISRFANSAVYHRPGFRRDIGRTIYGWVADILATSNFLFNVL
jgi:hypothetical protein